DRPSRQPSVRYNVYARKIDNNGKVSSSLVCTDQLSCRTNETGAFCATASRRTCRVFVSSGRMREMPELLLLVLPSLTGATLRVSRIFRTCVSVSAVGVNCAGFRVGTPESG